MWWLILPRSFCPATTTAPLLPTHLSSLTNAFPDLLLFSGTTVQYPSWLSLSLPIACLLACVSVTKFFAFGFWRCVTAQVRVCADGGANRVFDEMPLLFPSDDALDVRQRSLSLFNFIYIERLLLRFYMIKICSFILLLGLKLVLIDTKTKSFLTGSMLMVDSWLNEISKAKSGVDRVVLKWTNPELFICVGESWCLFWSFLGKNTYSCAIICLLKRLRDCWDPTQSSTLD